MSDEQKTSQEEPRGPFNDIPFAAMMEKMMGRQGKGCDGAEIMSQMLAKCGRAQDEKKKNLPQKQPGKHEERQDVNE